MSSEQMIVQNVDALQFSIMGPDEIRSRSVVEITKNETYEKDVPVVKGLFDLRMGTTELGKTCTTCGQGNKHCPGHFGHIELAKPIYHYHFIDITTKLLRCVCFRCGQLLVNPESARIKQIARKAPKVRFKEIYELSTKLTRCGQETENGCGCQQPTRYKTNGISGIDATWSQLVGEGKFVQKLQAEYVKMLCEKISVEDYTLLGFSEEWCKPEWLICSVVPVPPPSVRPSVKKQGDSQRMEDDLTHKFVDIIKFNNGLKQKIDSHCRQELIDDWTEMVQYHVATMIDNEISGVSQSSYKCSGRPIKAIRQRLKGKEGRIRSNLMGKRVDYSARSVITPDPNIELDELGVPIKIAINLTYPEIVNAYNIESLTRYVRHGPHVWPGAKNIIKGTVKLSLTPTNKDTIQLDMGDTVNRHLMDGDYVLFNRQPSLHKMSMMGHRVRVMKGNTFRLNVSVTPPYNADFDGDEMNMHAPQSIQSVSELINIASVDLQIISPRENKPIITIVQDTLLGVYKLTNSEIIQFPMGAAYHYAKNTNVYKIPEGSQGHACVPSCVFTRTQMMNIVSDLSTFHGIPPDSDMMIEVGGEPIEMWSGHALLSFILPDSLNLTMPNGRYDDVNDSQEETEGIKKMLQDHNKTINIVKIVSGMITQGTFDKSLFSKTSKGLIHTINNDLGPMRAHQLIDDLQKIMGQFLLIEGFSVGISDMLADKDTGDKIKDVIRDRKKEIESIMQEVHLDIFEDVPGKSKNTFFEGKVNAKLNKTIKDTGKIGLDNLDPKNRTTW
jgi:DNA-directed RNA polymerase II subunit RPB1